MQARQRRDETRLAMLMAKLLNARLPDLGRCDLSQQIALALFRIAHIRLEELHDWRIHAV